MCTLKRSDLLLWQPEYIAVGVGCVYYWRNSTEQRPRCSVALPPLQLSPLFLDRHLSVTVAATAAPQPAHSSCAGALAQNKTSALPKGAMPCSVDANHTLESKCDEAPNNGCSTLSHSQGPLHRKAQSLPCCPKQHDSPHRPGTAPLKAINFSIPTSHNMHTNCAPAQQHDATRRRCQHGQRNPTVC